MGSCTFTYYCVFCSSCSSKKYCLRLRKVFFQFIFLLLWWISNLISFVALFLCFRYFCQSWLICLESKSIGFRIFFYSISKFIWKMSSANRPIICRKWQFQVTNIILSIWIQDSIFKAQEKLLQSNLFGFKIQDSRLKAFGFKKFSLLASWILNLESYPLDSRSFFWDLEPWIFNPTPLDSKSAFGVLNLESSILDPIYLGKDGMVTKLQGKKNCWSPKNVLSFRVERLRKTM